MKKQTISGQVNQTDKKAWLESINKLSRIAIFGSKVNPAITLRMKGLLSKAEFNRTKDWYEGIAKREAKRLQKLHPFVGVSA